MGKRSFRPWKIAIRDPRNKGVTGYLELSDRAVATSGNYEQYFSDGKNDYGHIFDPRTGYPKEPDMLSVTVIAPDSLTADCLSTAIFVLGKEEGEQLARKLDNVEVKIIER